MALLADELEVQLTALDEEDHQEVVQEVHIGCHVGINWRPVPAREYQSFTTANVACCRRRYSGRRRAGWLGSSMSAIEANRTSA